MNSLLYLIKSAKEKGEIIVNRCRTEIFGSCGSKILKCLAR